MVSASTQRYHRRQARQRAEKAALLERIEQLQRQAAQQQQVIARLLEKK